MTQNGNCYENAMAERVNGILKMNLALDYATPASIFDPNFKELKSRLRVNYN